VTAAGLVAGAEDLGLDGDTVAELAAAWRGDECAGTHGLLAGAVRARLDRVQYEIAEHQRRATQAGPGTAAWAEANHATVALAENAARLQAVREALTVAPHAGPCGESCTCVAALAAPGTRFHFPSDAASGVGPLSCDLAADGGEARDRIAAWQQVLARVESRDALADADSGVVLRFPFDVELAATLARLAAAEYRCCSFGSYAIVVDESGLRLEIRMPAGAGEMLAAVVGRPDATATAPVGDR
jgi:hypothetical protein